ncbi:hypothetical protein Zm00014a_027061 [Zea mays]|uniref:MATH domain-containing protein n=2 Tax=Zea mays TaxID=4577 RepID=A0A3L6F078_MAIZE|nr:hypothetical protein Zm00014a_027061 [Zea mays]PWZ26420.1 hypothetical protein Zm00014a_027061 [Zea mays]PWZ26421.1 hypothetical protein Zm00014a_027061 [Zea mays]
MKPTTSAAAAAAVAAVIVTTDDPSPSPSDSTSATFTVDRRGDASASCRWTLPDFPRTRARTFYSRYFEVGGFDCRLLLYPRGDSQALPGYLSLYLQVLDPKAPVSSSSSTTTTTSSKWDCFLSYRLSVVHPPIQPSRWAAIPGTDSRPRSAPTDGQSQPPCHLSVFLEVTDPRNTTTEWSCFVSHRLSVINQKVEEKSIMKESQNRYSKSAKDWGWREFVTLTSLFDQDAGFLVQDTVVFSAEVLILKETATMQELTDEDSETCSSTYGCVYESFDTICIYLESDQSSGYDPDKNFWVHYKMAIVNQKNSAKTVCKESSICTKTWNNSVLQFMKTSDMVDTDAGFLVRDTVIFTCEIIDCCPWFDFSDLEVWASDDDQDELSTDPDELVDSEESEDMSGDEEDMFRNLLLRAGFSLTYKDNYTQPQVILREKL